MHWRIAVVLVSLALPACAPGPRTLGAGDLLRPGLSVAPDGARLFVARPAWVQVFEETDEGFVEVFPGAEEPPVRLERGWQRVPLPVVGAARMTTCAGGESLVSGWDDRAGRLSPGQTRVVSSRGERVRCVRTQLASPARQGVTRALVIVASEEPLGPARVEAAFASAPPPSSHDALDRAVAVAGALVVAGGAERTAAHVSLQRLSRD
ncbi:MAG: hypothetical protein AMXMBFR53_28390 [Gemmatimonadota bacterium]